MTTVKKSEIVFLLKCIRILYSPIGLNRFHFYKNTIVEIGKWYKNYAIFFFALIISVLIYTIHLDVMLIVKKYGYNSSLSINASFTYFILIVTFSVVYMRSIYTDSKLSVEIYSNFLHIVKLLEINDNFNKSRLTLIICKFYIPLILFKIIYIIIGRIMWPEYNTSVRHVTNTLIDFEVIRLSIEGNLVSKILKMFREQTKHTIIVGGQESRSRIGVKELNVMINIHSKLLNTIEKLNSCYSLKVQNIIYFYVRYF